ncbi:MAG: SPOR domain-containing protein [Acidobacteriota bacterium]
MPFFSLLARRLVPLCLAAALPWAAFGRQPQAAWAQALALDACGAFQGATAPGGVWPGAKAVRLGESVLPGDAGLGCRFVLTGEPAGAAAVVEARLTRPGSDGRPVEDRWFVPVRRGEAAVAAYGFAPGEAATAGPWSLRLAAEGISPVTARFVVAASAGIPGTPVQAAPSPLAGNTPAPLPAGEPAVPAPAPEQTSVPAPAAASGQAAAPPAAPSPAANPPAMPQAPAATAQAAPAVPAKPVAPPADKPAVRAKDQPSPPAAPHPQAAAKPAALAGYVALQTGLFADDGNAAAQAAKLRSRGMPACLSVSGSGDKRRYRVLAGRFGDRRAAAEARPAVTAILGLPPVAYDVAPSEAARLRCR